MIKVYEEGKLVRVDLTTEEKMALARKNIQLLKEQRQCRKSK